MELGKINKCLFRCCLFCFALSPIIGISQQTDLISFELKDQYKTYYTENSWPDSVLIILGSDRVGSDFNPIWAKAIYDSTHIILPNLAIKQMGIANLKGVPFFLKGFIRNKFPRENKVWILMDWSGLFSKTYHFVANECNILIFDNNRLLLYQTEVKELDEVKLDEILSILRKLK